MSPTRRPLARVAASACALLVLTGCGTGLRAQTYLEKSTADSTNDAVGFLAVRNLAVMGPTTGTVWPPTCTSTSSGSSERKAENRRSTLSA